MSCLFLHTGSKIWENVKFKIWDSGDLWFISYSLLIPAWMSCSLLQYILPLRLNQGRNWVFFLEGGGTPSETLAGGCIENCHNFFIKKLVILMIFFTYYIVLSSYLLLSVTFCSLLSIFKFFWFSWDSQISTISEKFG